MANSTLGMVFEIDTAGATVLRMPSGRLKSVAWVGATTIGHTCVVTDINGNVVFSSTASVANFVDRQLLNLPISAVKVPTLASGKVYLQWA